MLPLLPNDDTEGAAEAGVGISTVALVLSTVPVLEVGDFSCRLERDLIVGVSFGLS